MWRLLILLVLTSCGDLDLLIEEDGVQTYEHRIFVTEGLYPANFQRLTQADNYCQVEARAAGLTKTYKAIISGSNTNARNRIQLFGSVYNVDQSGQLIKVVDSGPRLWDTFNYRLLSPIVYDANGSMRGGYVWTGSSSEGSIAYEHCLNWTSNSASSSAKASVGSVGAYNHEWLEFFPSLGCNETARFYCISQ